MTTQFKRLGIFTPSTGISNSSACLDFVKKRGGLIQAWTIAAQFAHEVKLGLILSDIISGIKESSIRVSSLSGYMDWTVEENNEQRKEEFKRIIRQCAECRTKIICTETGRNFTDRADARAWELLTASMKELTGEAEKAGVCIAIEMGRRDLVFGIDLFRKLQKSVGSNSLKLNFDPANLLMGKIDPLTAIKELKDDVVQVHLKDASSKPSMTPLTKGEVDFLKIIEFLESNGYKGNYIIEQEYENSQNGEAVACDYCNISRLLSENNIHL